VFSLPKDDEILRQGVRRVFVYQREGFHKRKGVGRNRPQGEGKPLEQDGVKVPIMYLLISQRLAYLRVCSRATELLPTSGRISSSVNLYGRESTTLRTS